jgi:valyl-tRNA synthetase
VTSELWDALGAFTGVGDDAAGRPQLAEAAWPAARPERSDPGAERDFARLQAAVGAVRALRSDADLPPGQQVPLLIEGAGAEALRAEASVFASLARVVLREASTDEAGAALAQPVDDLLLRLPFAGVVDVAAWRAKQEKRLATQRADGARSRGKLAQERFVAHAPPEVVAEERRRLAEAERLAAAIEASLAQVA